MLSHLSLPAMLMLIFITCCFGDPQQADKVLKLPGQAFNQNFSHYSGYVTVEEAPAGRHLFYWLIESSDQPTTKPLVLWLSGGPGCSSVAFGEAEELGPFHIQQDGVTLYLNPYAWNQAANILFLDSPAGVGYSYSTSVDDTLNIGDKRTAENSLTFLLLWLERFPQYKGRDLYLTGESYAGFYVPQLAQAIMRYTTNKNISINLKGYMVGNPTIDFVHEQVGFYQYMWSMGLVSDQTYYNLNKTCVGEGNYARGTDTCNKILAAAFEEMGSIDVYNIFANKSTDTFAANHILERLMVADDQSNRNDPRTKYFNLPEVQKALHVNPQFEHPWAVCRDAITHNWKDSAVSVLDIYRESIEAGLRIWVISGNTDAVIPVTATRFTLGVMNLKTVSSWRSWTLDGQVGGWVQEYKGLTFVVVHGAGHEIPKNKPKEALAVFRSFLSGNAP